MTKRKSVSNIIGESLRSGTNRDAETSSWVRAKFACGRSAYVLEILKSNDFFDFDKRLSASETGLATALTLAVRLQGAGRIKPPPPVRSSLGILVLHLLHAQTAITHRGNLRASRQL